VQRVGERGIGLVGSSQSAVTTGSRRQRSSLQYAVRNWHQ